LPLAGTSGSGVAAVLLMLYLAFAALLYGWGLYRRQALENALWYRLDAAWLVAAIAASGGSASVLYPLLIFPVVAAASLRGRDEGLTILLVASGSVSLLLGLTAEAGGAAWQAAASGAALLVLAYLLVRWADRLARRDEALLLLTKIGRFTQPTPSVDGLLGEVLPQLREFYGAANCMAVIAIGEATPQLYAASPGVLALDESELAMQLLALPEHCALLYRDQGWLTGANATRARVWLDDSAEEKDFAAARQRANELAAQLNVPSWISVPWQLPDTLRGRLVVLAEQASFDSADLGLLHQAGTALAPALGVANQLESMIARAAEHERKKISLDLHDSAIQPYLGLKLALEALRRKVEPSSPLARDLDDLCWMTKESIGELRGYVKVLNQRNAKPAVSLADGLRRQIERFRGFYGIEVDVNYLSAMPLNDQLTAEVLHMIAESLSNIGRHTKSRRVTINLSCQDAHLVTQIIDQGAVGNEAVWRRFTPVSLSRRDEYLGGRVEVAHQPNGGTAVLVTIPL
jgi:signal transduction histidine kinase